MLILGIFGRLNDAFVLLFLLPLLYDTVVSVAALSIELFISSQEGFKRP